MTFYESIAAELMLRHDLTSQVDLATVPNPDGYANIEGAVRINEFFFWTAVAQTDIRVYVSPEVAQEYATSFFENINEVILRPHDAGIPAEDVDRDLETMLAELDLAIESVSE